MKQVLIFSLMIYAVSGCLAESHQHTKRPEAEYFAAAYAQHYRVPVPFVRAIVERESDWRVCAVSSKGAVGLMQLHADNCQALGSQGPLQHRSKRLWWRALPGMADAAVSQRSQAGSSRLLRGRTRDREARPGVPQSGRGRVCVENQSNLSSPSRIRSEA